MSTADVERPATGAESADQPTTPGAERPTLRSAGRFVVQVTAWLVILVLMAALTAAVFVPRLVGRRPPSPSSPGRWRPTYPPGTLIVDKPVDPVDVEIGSAVTFQIESGRPDVVTHRVIAVRTGADGKPEFMTQGDANGAPDANWRPSAAVRGEVWYAIPHLGRIDGVLSGHTRQLGVYAVAGLLAIYAGANLLGAARDRRRTEVEDLALHGLTALHPHAPRALHPTPREEEPDERQALAPQPPQAPSWPRWSPCSSPRCC